MLGPNEKVPFIVDISNLKLKERENKTLMELVIENSQQISTQGISDEN